MIPGIDLLGMAHKKWNIKATVKALKATGSANIGLFADETFGPNALKHAKMCLDTGAVKKIRAHLNWAGPNPKHTLPPLTKVKTLAMKWESLAKEYPGVEFFISPSCEYQSTDKKAITAMLKTAQDYAPSCKIVHSPMKPAHVVMPGILELHGDEKVTAGNILSFDGGAEGLDEGGVYSLDVTKWIQRSKDAAMVLAWAGLCNMQEAHNTLKPQERTESPSFEYTMGMFRLFEDPGAPPTPNFKAIPLKKPLLYKNFSEDSPGPDKRNNRPLIFAYEQAPQVELVTHEGKAFGRFAYYGSYHPNLSRYYSGWKNGIGLYGWEIADRCFQTSGSKWGFYKVKGKFYGPIHFNFRTGYFR